MSTHQRVSSVRRNASPASATGSTKQGPMKAILPVSLMRQAPSPTRYSQKNNSKANLTPSTSNSPTTASWIVDNPCSRVISSSRRSPDNRISPERRSLGSPSCKEKSRTLNTRSSTNTNSNSSTSPVIRRTASLDAIYLSGYWPKEVFRSYCGHLMVDKATQTPEEWEELEKKRSPQKKSTGTSDYQLEKFIRQRLQRTKEVAVGTHCHHHHYHHHHHHHHYSHTSPVQGDHNAISVNSAPITTEASTNTKSRAVPIPIPPICKPLIPRMRNSVEGLNQEIEKLVLKGGLDNDEECNPERMQEPTPDGHRAPIADLFLSGTTVTSANPVVNNFINLTPSATSHNDADTQTPYSPSHSSRGNSDLSGLILSEESGGSSTTSSGTGSRCQSTSPLVPIIPGLAGSSMDSSRPSSQSDVQNGKESKYTVISHSKSASPESDANTHTKLGTSPHINKFLEREPPDGCERVSVEELKHCTLSTSPLFCPMKPSMNFVLKPSLGSAFCPLEKGHFAKISDKDSSSPFVVKHS